MGEGGKQGALLSGGGGEAGRAGVCLRGAAGLMRGGGDGERVLSGVAHGRTCAPQCLAEEWSLPLG